MATVSVTNLRTQTAQASTFLSIFQPATLLTALVNNGSITRGARSIVFDSGTGSGFATITAGQTLEVDTVYGTKRVRIKSITGSQASGTITVDENAIIWGDNLPIRIFHLYEVHPAPPAIRSGVFYKFFDTVYSNQNLTPNPVVIMGSHRADTLTAGSVVFNLDASGSYAVAQGATISSYLWTCVHNGGGTTGITIASAASATTTLTLTLADQYWLSCTVTDSNGKSLTSYRAVFTETPYKDFTIQSMSGDWQSGGWRTSIQATGDVDLSEFPDRSLVVIWYENTFNGAPGYTNLWGVSNNILTCGYLRQDNDNDDFTKGTGQTTFQITTIDDLLNNISELGSVSLNATASPVTWWQYASWMTTGRSIHHLLLWQAWGLFQTCDVYGLASNTQGVKNTDYTESSLLQQVNGFAYNRGIFAKLISDRLGRLHLVQDSQMLTDAQRAALDTVFVITEADVSGSVDVARAPEEQTTFTQLDGFSFNGTTSTPFLSIIPGYRESSISYIMPEERGGSTAAVSNQVLTDQTDSNVRVGRYHALQNNNPRELRFSNPSNYIGAFDIIPSAGWYEWGIPDADLKRNTELFERLMVCRHIDVRFNHPAGTIFTDVVLEPEAIGPPGIQGNYPTGYPAATAPEPDWDASGAEGLSTAPFAITTYYSDTANKVFAQLVTLDPLSLSSQVDTLLTTANAGVLCNISATQAVFVWTDSTIFHAMVLTASGGTVIIGADNSLFDNVSSSSQHFSLVGMSSTTALLVFFDNRTAQDCSAVMLTIAGDTVTAGVIEIVEAGHDPETVTVARLSATAAIAAWSDANGGGRGWANIMAINGNDVNGGTSFQFVAGAVSVRAPGITTLSSSVAVVFYGRSSDSYHPAAKPIYGISGGSSNLGNENQLDPTDVLQLIVNNSRRKNTKISTTKSVIGYKETVDDEQFVVAVRYGDTVGGVAAGPVLKIDDNAGVAYTDDLYPQITSVSATKIVAAFIKESGGGTKGRILTVSIASDLTCTSDGNEIALSTDDIHNIDIIALRDVV